MVAPSWDSICTQKTPISSEQSSAREAARGSQSSVVRHGGFSDNVLPPLASDFLDRTPGIPVVSDCKLSRIPSK
eukprot:71254-Chlamydomonas_euryale.AAC.6